MTPDMAEKEGKWGDMQTTKRKPKKRPNMKDDNEKVDLRGLERLGLYLYVAAMTAFFAMQAVYSVRSYLAKKVGTIQERVILSDCHIVCVPFQIIEDVDVKPRMYATMPSVTICPFPGLKAAGQPAYLGNISLFCANKSVEVTRQCIDDLT